MASVQLAKTIPEKATGQRQSDLDDLEKMLGATSMSKSNEFVLSSVAKDIQGVQSKMDTLAVADSKFAEDIRSLEFAISLIDTKLSKREENPALFQAIEADLSNIAGEIQK